MAENKTAAFPQPLLFRPLTIATAALAFAAAAISAPATRAEMKTDLPEVFAPNVESFALDNGMEVVVIPDRRAPVVTHMVWYKVGAADEPPGQSGIAHYLEHLMFRGTKNLADGEFSEKVASLGGRENAFTAQDYTGYFQRVASEHLRLVMELEAERMANLDLSEAVVEKERGVVLEERNSRVENEPSSRLFEALNAAFWKNHPYGVPIIGWRSEIEAITRDQLHDFYDRFYTPNNAVLVVAGDVDTAEVRALAEEIYGAVPRRAEPGERVRPQEPAHETERRVILSDPRVTQPSMTRFYLVPSYTQAEPLEAEALDILAEIVGGGSTSRLHRELVMEKGIATSAGAFYSGTALDMSRFGFFGSPRGDVTLEEIEAAIDAVVAEVLENGVTEEEVASAQNSLVAAAVYAQDRQSALARIFGAALTSGSTVADVQAWPAEIAKVTVEDVNAVARRYLDRRRSATGFLLPEAAERS